ncbi:MAG: M48 family metallopeptidase [Burkholderiales bacterium]|nr:M48 family metallopeptidase [Burkholderiales bacterium]
MATFFERQETARRNTRLLVLLYAAAVIGVVIAVDLVVATAYLWAVGDRLRADARPPEFGGLYRLVPAAVYVWGAVATAATILAVSVWNVAKLAQGGRKVAELVGARRVRPDTADPLERRYLNVVEEMAIAAGMRVPAAYVMDGEPGINAFAAGYTVSDAVVAVTRGALEHLDRDELQGVIGHEFSHILNGDMRLDIRMLGVLAGIVFVGSVGEFLLRAQRGDGRSRSGPLLVVGLALLVVGYVGLFFARLIKAAVARQREFLADAASVQFTRNPEAVAGALDRLRSEPVGTLIRDRHAEELSHMFFAEAVALWFERLFATHPPIEERIRRVYPHFEPRLYREKRARRAQAFAQAQALAGERREAAAALLAEATLSGVGRRAGDAASAWGRSAGAAAALVGTTDGATLDYARRLLAALPQELKARMRTPHGARAALVALALALREDARRGQLAALRAAGLEAIAEEAEAIAPLAARIGPPSRLPAIDLALAALKGAPEDLRRDAVRALEAVVHADQRVSVHEFVVLTLVRAQLFPPPKPVAGDQRLADLAPQAALLVSLVAHAGTRQDAIGARAEAVAAAISAGAAEMGIEAKTAGALTPEGAAAALEALRELAPLQKAILVRGLFATATYDGRIRLAEAELLRLVGAVLDCPLPPLLETLDPATLAP